MNPEEIATLRLMATTAGLVSVTGKELSALLLERDHHAAEAKALREASELLIGKLAETLHGADLPECSEIRGGGCERIPMRYLGWEGDGGDYCDVCAGRITEGPGHERPLRAEDLPHAPALRAIRALLGRTP